MPLAVRIAAEGFHPPLLAKVAKKRRAGELVAVSKRGRVRKDVAEQDAIFAIAIDDHEANDRVSLQRRGIVNVEYIDDAAVKLGTPLTVDTADYATRKFKFKKAARSDTVYAFVVEHVRQAGHSYTRIMMTPGVNAGRGGVPAVAPAVAPPVVAVPTSTQIAALKTILDRTRVDQTSAAYVRVTNLPVGDDGEKQAKFAALTTLKDAYATYDALAAAGAVKTAQGATKSAQWWADFTQEYLKFVTTVGGDVYRGDTEVKAAFEEDETKYMELLQHVLKYPPDARRSASSEALFQSIIEQFSRALNNGNENKDATEFVTAFRQLFQVYSNTEIVANSQQVANELKQYYTKALQSVRDGKDSVAKFYKNIVTYDADQSSAYQTELEALKKNQKMKGVGECIQILNEELLRVNALTSKP